MLLKYKKEITEITRTPSSLGMNIGKRKRLKIKKTESDYYMDTNDH